MAYEVAWTDNINEDIDDILSYLESVASHKVAEKFLNELREKVSILTKFPESGRQSQKDETVRSLLFRKHYWVFYTIIGQEIIMLDIFDTRQDPAKSPY